MEPNSTGFQSVDLCVEPREIIFPRLVVVVNSPYECQQWGKNPPNKEDYEVSQNLMHANLSITDGVYGMVSDDDVGVRINGMVTTWKALTQRILLVFLTGAPNSKIIFVQKFVNEFHIATVYDFLDITTD